MKILIIRHGDPDYSIDSLTEKGWREAELLSKRLSKMNIQDFYVSPLGRAQDTAKPTLEKLGRTAQTLPWLHELQDERGYVVEPISGKKRVACILSPRYWTKQPELYDRVHWRENSLYSSGNLPQVYDETAAGMDALLEQYGYVRDGGIFRCDHNDDKTIAMFCHYGVGMLLVAHMMRISPAMMWQCFFMPTSSVTTLITEEREKGEVFFKCMQMGDTSHLYAGDEPLSRMGLHNEIYQA